MSPPPPPPPSSALAAHVDNALRSLKLYLPSVVARLVPANSSALATALLVALPLALAAVPAGFAANVAIKIAKARRKEERLSAPPISIPRSPKSHPIWGLAAEFGKSTPTRVLQELHNTLGDIVLWRVLHRVNLTVADPKAAQLVMSKFNHDKSDYEGVRELVGDSLLTTNGAVWKGKRHSINPAFRVSFLKDIVVPVVVDRTHVMMDVLFPQSPKGGSVPLLDRMSQITLDVIGLAGFDYDFEFASKPTGNERLSAMVLNVLEEPSLRVTNPLRKFTMPRVARQYNKDLKEFKDLGRTVIREARRKLAHGSDEDKARVQRTILGLLLAQDDMTDAELLNEVVTFLFAGHETSASTLTFMFMCLDYHPECKRKLEQEVKEVLQGRDPTFDDLVKLRYLTAVMKETLRFFPIGWATARITGDESVKLGDYVLPPKTDIMINYIALHRNPKVWDRPLEFVPERWLSSNPADNVASEGVDAGSTGAVPFSYLPFSGGPRSCVGKPLAEIEIKLLVAMVVQRYDWKLEHPASWEGKPFWDLYKDGSTLRPLPHTVWMTPRKQE